MKKCNMNFLKKNLFEIPNVLATISTKVHNLKSAKYNITPLRKSCRKNHYYRNYSTNSVYLIDEENNNEIPKSKNCTYTTRSFTCGDLRLDNVGLHVSLCGWLEFRRLNKFLILRDGYGQTQLLIKENDNSIEEKLKNIPLESILRIEGTVLARPKDMINPKLSTGAIEVQIEKLDVMNKATELPFNIREFQRPHEALRMQFRYLDLRFPQMQRNMRVRSEFLFKIRQFLMEAQFVDVETPTLFKATPGGAQEFIVPTRFPGQFYSLVQSPQQFKQILMAGAIDRYFQIARCYRDETSRPDRQPEFTQLDIELSFTSVDGIMKLIEDLLGYCWPSFAETIPKKFQVIKHRDAMEKYGSDKPDISFGFEIKDISNILCGTNLNNFGESFSAGFIKFPKELSHLKKSKKKLESISKPYTNVKLIQNEIISFDSWKNRMSKLFSNEVLNNLENVLQLQEGDVLFLAYGDKGKTLELLGKIRLSHVNYLEDEVGLKVRKKGMHLAWISDFPLFEKNETNTLVSAHHPFTAPNPEDIHLLQTDPFKVRALAYDLVLNGHEIAGGSMRIHDPVLQGEIFKILNIEVANMKHLLDMLKSGCPPHGGIAIGLDRLLSILLKTQSIRDVIAFPKGSEGRDPLSGAPSSVSEEDLKLYHIKCLK